MIGTRKRSPTKICKKHSSTPVIVIPKIKKTNSPHSVIRLMFLGGGVKDTHIWSVTQNYLRSPALQTTDYVFSISESVLGELSQQVTLSHVKLSENHVRIPFPRSPQIKKATYGSVAPVPQRSGPGHAIRSKQENNHPLEKKAWSPNKWYKGETMGHTFVHEQCRKSSDYNPFSRFSK